MHGVRSISKIKVSNADANHTCIAGGSGTWLTDACIDLSSIMHGDFQHFRYSQGLSVFTGKWHAHAGQQAVRVSARCTRAPQQHHQGLCHSCSICIPSCICQASIKANPIPRCELARQTQLNTFFDDCNQSPPHVSRTCHMQHVYLQSVPVDTVVYGR